MAEALPADMRHEVDDLVITCMDHRFQKIYNQKLAEHDVQQADRVSYPGSSKAVADGTLISAIETANRLHNIKKVWIFDHTDCGAFGSLNAFDFDEAKESDAHFESLEKATRVIGKVLPHLTVVTFVIGLHGEEIASGADPRIAPNRQHQE